LPSEAQYEYSERGGTTTLYFWGDERDKLACEYSNQPDLDQGKAMGNVPMGPDYRFQCHDGYAWTSPVGTYKLNPFGLYDMAGNIWEWTADCWNPSYDGAPTDGSAWRSGDCDARPYRGGSFGNAAFSAYVAFRSPRYAEFNGHSWGFRVVQND
jgi:formylglycine-generating enzyme required for sulfatase activity